MGASSLSPFSAFLPCSSLRSSISLSPPPPPPSLVTTLSPNSILSLPRTHKTEIFEYPCFWNEPPKKARDWKPRGTRVPSSGSFSAKIKDRKSLKEKLLEGIAPLDRGADATFEDKERIDQIACELEAINEIKEPLKSDLLNGKWELLYTTSTSILQTKRPKFLRANGKIFQAINVDTLRAQNMETWPFFNQATANLVPLNANRVAVKFDSFKIASVIPIMSRGSGCGELEITYLDKELRISRGNEGNLFILKMVDRSYRVPT